MSPAKKQSASLKAAVATLAALPIERLRAQYEQAFEKPAGKTKRDHMLRALAERGTAPAQAASSATTKPAAPTPTKAPKAARKPAKGTRDPRLPATGTTLRRECKGQQIEVKVLADGFEWKGERFRSLSAVATKAYGCPANGFLFFGLVPKAKTQASAAPTPAPAAPSRRKPGRPIAPRRSK